jgi:hypothetical protein
MKKIILIAALILTGATVTTAKAATLSTAPATINVVSGQIFTLPITVDTQGAKVTTVKAQLVYPANLVEATGFSFGTGWMPLSQSGYDTMAGGVLIKTAGFPGGFEGTKILGTATFRAITSGTATISVSNASQVLNNQSLNVFTSGTGTTLSVAAAPAQATPNQPATNPTTGAANTPASSNAESNTANVLNAFGNESQDEEVAPSDEFATEAGVENPDGNLAAAGATLGAWQRLKANGWWIVLVLLGLAAVWWFTRNKETQ